VSFLFILFRNDFNMWRIVRCDTG